VDKLEDAAVFFFLDRYSKRIHERVWPRKIYICDTGLSASVKIGQDFGKLLENLETGVVFEKEGEVYWMCRNCGYIHKGKSAPEQCPACLHPQSYFEVKAENY